MKIIDGLSLSQEENLAIDELFLNNAENGRIGETLRFWDSDKYFVVMGRSGRTREECALSNCREDGVKVLRRISGGGTVLQGKGCLNFSAVLSYSRNDAYKNIASCYAGIMGDLREGFRERGLEAEFLPISDLALKGRKFSGNAQARKRRYFLHHGTILYDMDMGKIERYLKHPPKEPDYRAGRAHVDFLGNIPLSVEDIKGVIKSVLAVSGDEWTPGEKDIEGLTELIDRKYSLDSWNLGF